MQEKFHEAIVNLSTQSVESNVRLGPNDHGTSDYDEILTIEKNVLEDEGVRAEIAKLQLPEGAVISSDPGIYGQC
jgi:primary-amine oxidase